MRKTIVAALLLGVAIGAVGGVTYTQSRPAHEAATYITRAEIEAVRKHTGPTGVGIDRQIKVVDLGDYNVGVGVLHRDAVKPAAGPVGGIAHTEVTEVYYVVSGSGLLVTGSAMSGSKPLPAEAEVVRVAVGPSVTGVFQGGERRRVSAGDVVIIPPGMLHGWAEVEDHVTYLSIRPDAGHVLPAGYVHPAIGGSR